MGRQLSTQPTAVGSKGCAASPITARLFGRFELTSSEGVPLELTCAKSRELLAYLLIHRDRAHRREAVADQMWGERTWGDQRKALRQALWQLQAVLSRVLNGGGQLIETLGPEWVRINSAIPVKMDIADFEKAWDEFETFSEIESPGTCISGITQALDLYRADLLEGEDWTWCFLERERLRSMYLVMSDRIASWCAQNGNFALGVRIASRTLEEDPAREKSHRSLMRLYTLTGDRTTALRQFETCTAALRVELGVDPSRKTQELFQQIRDDRLFDANCAELPSSISPAISAQATAALNSLQELRDLLDSMQQQVNREIEALERALPVKE